MKMKHTITIRIKFPKGYDVGFGWKGQMPDGTYRVFETEDEYKAAFWEALKKLLNK